MEIRFECLHICESVAKRKGKEGKRGKGCEKEKEKKTKKEKMIKDRKILLGGKALSQVAI